MPSVIPNESRSSRLLSLIATILMVVALYLAREVLVPLALALLLTFLLAPLVIRLQRWGVSRIPAVLLVSIVTFAILGVLGYVIASEAISLAESLPQYRENIREKVRAIASPGILSHATESLRQTTEDVIQATTQADPAATRPGEDSARGDGLHAGAGVSVPSPQTTPVRIVEPRTNALETLAQSVHPLLGPLGTAGIIVVFVIFMLIQREDLHNRIIALTGTSQINVTTTAFDDAATRVSRYLLMQFVVNVIYGLAVAIGLLVIGVPNAWLWGMCCVVLRYIPYVGTWLAASMPILLSLAVFDDWTRPLLVIGLFVVIELVSANALEPWLYGSGTGVSSIAILFAAVFWTWLWGLPGLVLSTPLTVCLVVLGRHVPQMKWLVVLLGEEPGLPLPSRVYQRLLAADHDEVLALAHEYLKDHTLPQWYDDVLMPALCMAEIDRHEGALDERREQAAFAVMRELIEELGDTVKVVPANTAKSGDAPSTSTSHPVESRIASVEDSIRTPVDLMAKPLILIVAAHDEADELAANMLAQLLDREGQRSQVLPAGVLTAEASEAAAIARPGIICVSSMPPTAVSHARYVCKRLHDRLPDARLVVGVWNANDLDRAAQRMRATGGETIVGTLARAMDALRM